MLIGDLNFYIVKCSRRSTFLVLSSDNFYGREEDVIITPLDALDNLTDEEIGQYVEIILKDDDKGSRKKDSSAEWKDWLEEDIIVCENEARMKAVANIAKSMNEPFVPFKMAFVEGSVLGG